MGRKTSIYLNDDVCELIDIYGVELSKEISEHILSKYGGLGLLKDKLDSKEKELEELKKIFYLREKWDKSKDSNNSKKRGELLKDIVEKRILWFERNLTNYKESTNDISHELLANFNSDQRNRGKKLITRNELFEMFEIAENLIKEKGGDTNAE